MRLPPKPFLRGILTRATWIWLFLHALTAGGMMAMRGTMAGVDAALGTGEAVSPLVPGGLVPVAWLWGVTALVLLAFMRGKGETLLLANLGVGRRHVAAVTVAWCALLDIGLLTLAAVAT